MGFVVAFFCPFDFLTKTRKRENGEKERQKIEKKNERQKKYYLFSVDNIAV